LKPQQVDFRAKGFFVFTLQNREYCAGRLEDSMNFFDKLKRKIEKSVFRSHHEVLNTRQRHIFLFPALISQMDRQESSAFFKQKRRERFCIKPHITYLLNCKLFT
jgi:hypothetical protein